jgi:hypothetical protein
MADNVDNMIDALDMQTKYWAADETEKIGDLVIKKFKAWQYYCRDTGIVKELRKSYKAFYGSTEVKDAGESLRAIHINNYASLIRNLHVMVTSQRPAWQPRAINSDLESQAAADLGAGLLDYYMREKHLESKINKATETALVLREGWLTVDWDVNAGEIIRTDEDLKNPIFEGDISVQTYSMLDVCRDVYKRNHTSHHWYIVREYRNKYDLAETYPDLAEKILKLRVDERQEVEFELNPWFINRSAYTASDLVPIYKLYHDKTPAMPNGRLSIVADKDVILFDGPLPYKRPYLFRISTTEVFDMPLGHSNMFDLLAIQDALDMTVSAILTNQAANAVQNFQMPKGSGLKVTNITDGLRVVEFDPKLGPIQPLNLLQTAPEVFTFGDKLNDWMQLLSNVSSISRGDAPASMSGTAMALLQQQSIQFNSGLQLAHTQLLENTGTAIIELLQEFAEEPRLAIIAGKTKQPLMKYFSGADLKGINRVIVDTANPLTKTSAGRVEIANQLLQTPGMIKTPEQYLSVLTTGTLEPIYEHDRSRQYLTRAENEAMMNGETVEALLTDDHAIHALEHSCVLNSLQARKRPEIVQTVLTHIQQHIDLAKQMSPEMAAMLKQTSFAPPPAPQGAGVQPEMVNAQPPLEQQAAPGQVNLPKPAQSPLPPIG